ncbi:L-2-hydroxyglutarate oxidase [Phyllobacterium sp. SB3]|uniref:L-2-hydroxyglutarate oxidase n=1 Tax=Phyllobacterium sp. SB3 TaxID=3156073 RepID=UPI0032AF88FD
MMIYDFCVIGGGIVGLATALELTRLRPGAGVLVLEKETGLGRHQTGHNSGVIHAGIYYKPGSLKADLCRRGATATKQFCTENNIPFETRGKLVVATTPTELARMANLRVNAALNQIDVEEIDDAELKRREPNITGLGALFVSQTGIVDYRRICEVMGELIGKAGGSIEYGARVDALAETAEYVIVAAGGKRWQAKQIIACGGLQSDRLAKLAGLDAGFQIVPFRGEYYDVSPRKGALVRHLIYPVPDPDLPFLGIHLTPMIDGSLTVGPNAVLGLAREQYAKFSFNLKDVMSFAQFPGFWRLISKNLQSGLTEAGNSLFKARYLAECRKYCPSLELGDLVAREAGIRAQAVMRDGTLVHDFMILRTPRTLHVGNAPSPAATASIPIGEMIAREATERQS